LNEDFSHHICVINNFQCGFVKICAHLLIFLGLCWYWIWFCWYAYLSWCLKGISHIHTYYAYPNVNKKIDICAFSKGLVFQFSNKTYALWAWYMQFFFLYLLSMVEAHNHPTMVKTMDFRSNFLWPRPKLTPFC
jgi:hypothetical protein